MDLGKTQAIFKLSNLDYKLFLCKQTVQRLLL